MRIVRLAHKSSSIWGGRHAGKRTGLLKSNRRRGPQLALNLEFHAFRSRADTGVVVASVLHHLVDQIVVVIWIVVKQHQFLGAALHHNVDRLAPVTMSPAAP